MTETFAERALKITDDDAYSEERIALVIGNGAYTSSPLKNPVNDATDMAKKLETLGFTVKKLLNADQEQMEKAIDQFGSDLKKGGVGLFYYAGHGMQVRGTNYLIPVGKEIADEGDVKYRAVDAGLVLQKMDSAHNRLNIVLLDACRNNPFARSFRSASRGLAQMDAPSGTLIVYATAPGRTAADGNGRNGIFTKNLLKSLDEHGNFELEQLMKEVRKGVQDDTGKGQMPWLSTSTTGNFYFINVHVDKAKEDNTVVVASGKKEYDEEEELWRAIRDSRVPEDFRDYITTYPKGRFRKAAKAMLQRLETIPKNDEKKHSINAPKKSKPKKNITNSLGMTFVYIEPGKFIMGSPTDEPDRDNDETPHTVTLTQGYYIQTTEVTNGQWEKVWSVVPNDNTISSEELKSRLGEEGVNELGEILQKRLNSVQRYTRQEKGCDDDNCPAQYVSWTNAKAFIEKLNKMEGQTGYRFPTEAEWEYACRAGKTTPFSFGNCLSTDQANYNGNHPLSGCGKGIYRNEILKTESFQPNAWGLFDMHGNVWEWCADWKGDYPVWSVTDPKGPEEGVDRVCRGGSYDERERRCRSSYRNCASPDAKGRCLGLRLVMTP